MTLDTIDMCLGMFEQDGNLAHLKDCEDMLVETIL